MADGLNRLGSIGGSAASYDARGNLTADPTSGKAFTYWPSDNALWIASPPWTALSYDPVGRLALIDSASDSAFAYDGLDMVAEYDGAGTMLARYVHGPGIDQPLVRYDGSGTSNKQSLHADERGSITALSYGSPYAPTINRYDEYGKPQAGNIGRFQYTGQMWLGEAGVYYYKARTYAPNLGRFLQTDPVGAAGSPNLYAYVINDPIGLVDPFGLVQCTGSHLERDTCGESPDPVTCMGNCGVWATVLVKPAAGVGRDEGSGTYTDNISECLANLSLCLELAASGQSISNQQRDSQGRILIGSGTVRSGVLVAGQFFRVPFGEQFIYITTQTDTAATPGSSPSFGNPLRALIPLGSIVLGFGDLGTGRYSSSVFAPVSVFRRITSRYEIPSGTNAVWVMPYINTPSPTYFVLQTSM